MYWGYISAYSLHKRASIEGNSFLWNKGFPNLSLCYVTKWEFSLKNVSYAYLLLDPI